MSELNAIEEVVLQYFQALYDGDVAQVEDVFLQAIRAQALPRD